MLAVSPEERSELELEEPHTELAERYVDSHLGSEKGRDFVDPHHADADSVADSTDHSDADPDSYFQLMWIRMRIRLFNPDADPDPDPSYQIKDQTLKSAHIGPYSLHFGLSSAN